jgi:hypothetical protein
VKYITKTVATGMIVVSTIISGCNNTKEIRLSENVKNDVFVKVQDNKIKSEPLLQKKLDGLENQRILSWIDDENILTVNNDAFSIKERNVILYSYNLEKGQSTEILNDSNITSIYEFDDSGVVLLGNNKKVFVYDAKEEKLEEVLDFSKEFEDENTGRSPMKDILDVLFQTNLRLIKRDYISYSSRVNPDISKKKMMTTEYTILNYKENKKYTVESSSDGWGLSCKFDLTGKNIYIEEPDQITKLNLEMGNKSSLKLIEPKIVTVFEDGALLVECFEKNKSGNKTESYYKVGFDNKEIIKYDVNFGSKNLSIDAVDLKNEFVEFRYLGDGKDRNKNMAMYGKLEGNKLVLKDKLFKNNEDYGCNVDRNFIFSPDHNKFITGVEINKWEDESSESPMNTTDSEYLFELK